MLSSVHYRFAHGLLPHILFQRKEELFQEISSGSEYFLDYLKWIWVEAQGEEEDTLPDFTVIDMDLGAQTRFCLMEMPEPERPGEPLYIGIVFHEDRGCRYFLYEIGCSHQEMERFEVDEDFDMTPYLDCFFLCEWNEEGEHLNYGQHLDSRISYFLEQIKVHLGSMYSL